MISPAFDLEQFVEKVRGSDYFGIIQAAELEATAAERLSLKLRKCEDADIALNRSYAEVLKGLITFLRYGLIPPHLESYHYTLFKIICAEVSRQDPILSQCEDVRL